MQCFQKTGELFRPGGVFADHPRPALDGVQLRHQVPVGVARLLEVAVAEAEPQHRMTHRTVPASVDGQPLEQRLVALEELLQGVQEQALAEAPRTGQKVVGALIEQQIDVGGLVDVVAALLTEGAEGLDADGQLASGTHGHSLPHRRPVLAVSVRARFPLAGIAPARPASPPRPAIPPYGDRPTVRGRFPAPEDPLLPMPCLRFDRRWPDGPPALSRPMPWCRTAAPGRMSCTRRQSPFHWMGRALNPPAKSAPVRVRRDGWLSGEIGRVYDEHFEVYGVRKVWDQLRREGVGVAR